MNDSDYNFSDSDWNNTSEVVKQEFIRLQQRIKELEEKVNQQIVLLKKNSSNSTKPPSSDNPYKNNPHTRKTKTSTVAAAKAGHTGKRQPLLSPTNNIPIVPKTCTCSITNELLQKICKSLLTLSKV